MAGDVPVQDSIWPLPRFYFQVDIEGELTSFAEVTGLDTETHIIEYRHANSPEFSHIKMPGITKYGNVTLKKGIVSTGSTLLAWANPGQRLADKGFVHRSPLTIKLLDQDGNPTMIWTLSNAWPVKITSLDLKSDGNDVVIDTIEIAHEGITISNS